MTVAPAPSTTPIQDSLLSCFCYDENIGRDSPSFERTEVSSSNVSDFVVSVHVEDSAPTPAPQVAPAGGPFDDVATPDPAASLASRDFPPAPARGEPAFEPSAAELITRFPGGNVCLSSHLIRSVGSDLIFTCFVSCARTPLRPHRTCGTAPRL